MPMLSYNAHKNAKVARPGTSAKEETEIPEKTFDPGKYMELIPKYSNMVCYNRIKYFCLYIKPILLIFCDCVIPIISNVLVEKDRQLSQILFLLHVNVICIYLF
jgi:hypothetical protein